MQDAHRPTASLSLAPANAPGGALSELTHRAIAGRRIEEKHRQLANELGAPTREVSPSAGGYVRTFERGLICCEGVEPFAVYGVIYEKYDEVGRETGLLGFPSSDISPVADALVGRFARGVICWTEATGAHEVHGAILELWERLGAEQSYLGWPLTDELPRGRGRVSFFERGCIAWSPEGGAIDIPDLPGNGTH
jgi:uncharacterized protein with LGFP repeats